MRDGGLAAAFSSATLVRQVLQGPWVGGLLKPSKAWWADPISRYTDGATVRSKAQYTNRQGKRLFRGAGAVPARIEALGLKAERGGGGVAVWK